MTFFSASRILAISEAASVYPKGTLAVCIIHWLVMTVWLSVFEKTWFCISPTDLNFKNKVKEVSFCAVMGLVYIFSFVAVNDQPTRYKYTFYYSVCFLENSSSSIAWILESANSEAWILLLPPLTIFIVFALGIVMMLVYYSYYHPSMCYDAEVVMSLPNVALSPPVVKKNNHDSFTLAMGTWLIRVLLLLLYKTDLSVLPKIRSSADRTSLKCRLGTNDSLYIKKSVAKVEQTITLFLSVVRKHDC